MSRAGKIREIDEFPRRIKTFTVLIFFLFLIGTIGFKILNGSSLSEGFIRTLETLAFMFDDNSSLIERLLEIFMALVGVFLIWWILWSIADMILDGNLKKYLKTKFYLWKLSSMKNHTIIAGGGRIGEEIAKTVSLKNKNFIIIESDELKVKELRKKGYSVISGSAEDEKTMREAGIEKAEKLVLTLPKTETNILITLTAEDINPAIEVYSRAENENLIKKLKKAGAKIVIIPEVLAGGEIAKDLKL